MTVHLSHSFKGKCLQSCGDTWMHYSETVSVGMCRCVCIVICPPQYACVRMRGSVLLSAVWTDPADVHLVRGERRSTGLGVLQAEKKTKLGGVCDLTEEQEQCGRVGVRSPGVKWVGNHRQTSPSSSLPQPGMRSLSVDVPELLWSFIVLRSL